VTTAENFDVFSRAFEADPHPILAEWRRQSPVRPVVMPDGRTAWLVTRYDDVRRLINDPRLSKGGLVPPTGDSGVLPPQVQAAVSSHMLGADPPDHTRLRELVSAAFTAGRIEALRPRVQEITDDLLDAMAGRQKLDLIDSLTFPLPLQVIFELIGVPVIDRDNFRTWTNVIIGGLAERERVLAAMGALIGYVRHLLALKRAEPADDLLSALLAAGEDGDRLSDNELSSTVFLLLVAGYETSVSMLANIVYVLQSHRDVWELLCAEPALLPSAIEECLRFESPIGTATFRITTEEIPIRGQVISAGVPVLLSLLAANRDEARFAEPDRFDITRTDTNLAFGHGIHRCLGAPLASLEAEVAIGALLARYPSLRLAAGVEELEWRRGILIHGLAALPVTPG
jgi:cytochrome P450